MQEPTLRDVFRISWKLTFRYKVLWVLGLGALIFGQLGLLDVVTGIIKGVSPDKGLTFGSQVAYLFSPSTIEKIGSTLNYSFDSWAALAWLLIIILGFGIIFVIVASIAQGAMVHAAALSMEHGLKSIEKFDESWHAGAKNVSSILLLNVLKKSVLFAMSLIVGAAAFAALVYGDVSSTILFIICFISALIIGMTASVVSIFAVGYLVIEKKSLFNALASAWKLFTKHWLVSCEVGMVLITFNVVVCVLLCAGIYIFVAPSLAVNAYGALIGSAAISQFGTSMAIVLFLAYAAIIGSIFTVFVTTTWTYLFVIMHKWGIKSRIHAWISGFKRK